MSEGVETQIDIVGDATGELGANSRYRRQSLTLVRRGSFGFVSALDVIEVQKERFKIEGLEAALQICFRDFVLEWSPAHPCRKSTAPSINNATLGTTNGSLHSITAIVNDHVLRPTAASKKKLKWADGPVKSASRYIGPGLRAKRCCCVRRSC